MDYIYSENYWDNPEPKKKLIAFLKNIFNLDLSLWDNFGYWDKNYRPFSYFKDGELISSVCIYSMDMMVDGKQRKVAQVSAVGTLEEYRRQGINSELTCKATAWAEKEHDFFFLFADTDAFSYYKGHGFKRVTENKNIYPLEGIPTNNKSRKLNVNDKSDRDLIYRIATKREPVSNLLGILNEKLFMFWCLYFLRDNIYYIEQLDTLVLLERKNNVLTIYDIVSPKMPLFNDIYVHIGRPDDKSAEFLFMPDKLGLKNYDLAPLKKVSDCHIKGNFPLENQQFIFPCTSHA